MTGAQVIRVGDQGRAADVVEVGAGGAPTPIYVPGTGGTSGRSARLEATRMAAHTMSGHRVVTPLPDRTVVYADPTAVEHLHAPLWLTLGAAAAGDPVDLVLHGEVTEPSWTWTPGPLYLGPNGLLTQTPPTAAAALYLVQVGAATGPTAVFIDRNPSIQLV